MTNIGKLLRHRRNSSDWINSGKRAAYNSTFAIGGVSCSADTFVVAESSVLRINICADKPAHRKSAER